MKKEDNVRKNSKDVAAILLNNQNEISTGLEDLKKQFENSKKGEKAKKRQRSVDFGKIKRRTFQFDNDKEIMKKMNKINNNQGLNSDINSSNAKKKNINIKPVKRNTLFMADLKGLKISKKKKDSLKKDGFPKFDKPGSKLSNSNKNNKYNKYKNDAHKAIEEIKEEEKEMNENEVELKNEEKKDEDTEIEGKKSEDIKATPQKKSENKEEEINKIKVNNTVKNNKNENKLFNPMLEIKLKNLPGNQSRTEKKPKQQILHNNQNDMNAINKKLESNDKKVIFNLQKEILEKEKNILKIKNELKKGSNNKSSIDIGKNANSNKKSNNEPKVQGFKNIKDMIESNLKKQRVMSGMNIRLDKNKMVGKK